MPRPTAPKGSLITYRSGRMPWLSPAPSPEERAARVKLVYFGLLILILFGVLSAQLARLQLIDGDKYRARAETNRLRQEPIIPARGLIYDRNGVPLVENVATFAAAVVAADVPVGEETRTALALERVTGEPEAQILSLINERKASLDPFTPAVVKDNLSQDAAFILREQLASLPGVRVLAKPQREYQQSLLMSHILGFTGPLDAQEYERLKESGYQYADRIGKAGVEFTYEEQLRGVPGKQLVETDASGREISLIDEVAAVPGKSVVLSIDLELQRRVDEILRAGMGPSLNAAAIVINVHTGEILAMVSEPGYDANIFSGDVDQAALERLAADPAKPMLNHAISETYAPGSTFKQITGTAALQEGVATANTMIFSPGYLDVQNEYQPGTFQRFKDWRSDLGTMNFYRGLAMSSDVYFYYLAGGYFQGNQQVFQGLGAARLAEWARRFGLGKATGIDLPGEAEGVVPDPAWKQANFGQGWLLGDTYNMGIGQGYVAATPLQMLLVTSAIANGGNVLDPTVVKELRDVDGKTEAIDRQPVARNLNLDARNLAIMREGMRQAVADGSATTAQVPNVTVAGKTGTAEFGQQRPDGSYPEHGWFTGFAPFNNPEVAVVVFMQQGNGALTAAPTAANILNYYFNQYKAVQR